MDTTRTEVGGVQEPALATSTLCAAFQSMAARHPQWPALRTTQDGVALTWSEYADRVRSFACGLASLGVARGDSVALMLTNRPEFHIADAAAMHLGATPFSIYNTSSPSQIEYVLSDSKARVVITEPEFFDQVSAGSAGCVDLQRIVVCDPAPAGALGFSAVESATDGAFDFEASWRAAAPDQVLTLIYTSGTTGVPKAVEITHRNVIASLASYDQLIHFGEGGRVVSYLPMAHIAERMCSQYAPMLFGFTVTTCPGVRQVLSYLQEVHPTWFFGVPRVFEKLKAGLEAMMASEADEVRMRKAKEGVEAGVRRARMLSADTQPPPELERIWEEADRSIFSDLRRTLGLDQLKSLNVGAAPTPAEVIEFYHAIGLPLGELWGLSESCGAGTCNPPEAIKIGTVGPPAPGVEIRVADDGEVLMRGSVVMAGYRGQPELTSETIDADGWLHTGDVGEFQADGYLRIVDRKKELIINASGKNMSPAHIESEIKVQTTLIAQACVIGDRRPYNVALIVLDEDVARAFASAHGIDDTSPEALSADHKVLSEIQRAIDSANSKLSRVEQVKTFKVLPLDWQPGGEELTPTMKLKRNPIATKYSAEIEALYAS